MTQITASMTATTRSERPHRFQSDFMLRIRCLSDVAAFQSRAEIASAADQRYWTNISNPESPVCDSGHTLKDYEGIDTFPAANAQNCDFALFGCGQVDGT